MPEFERDGLTPAPPAAETVRGGQDRETSGASGSAAGRPGMLDAVSILHLQRTAGNAGVVQLLVDEGEEERSVHEVVGTGSGAPLDAATKSTMEGAFGDRFDDVRVHTGVQASRSAEAIGANAYTVGSDIVVRDGQMDQETVAHELEHVRQQKAGPVDGTDAPGGIRLSDPSDRFERAAAATADRVVSSVQRQPAAAASSSAATAQREAEEAPTPPKSPVEHYSLKEPGIALTSTVKDKVNEIANKYYETAKKDIVVTSGTRTAAEQADAMYTKLKGGDTLSVYLNQSAVTEIKKAYNDATTAKDSEEKIITAMTDVIQAQIDKGTYVSNHLKEGAVDIRNNDMSAAEKTKFEAAAKEAGITPLEEGVPPHFHLEIN